MLKKQAHNKTETHPTPFSPIPKTRANPLKLAAGAINNNYNRYFSSGVYKTRYPSVNIHSLRFINHSIGIAKNHTKKPVTLLDYGCGNGRYLLHLLKHHRKLRCYAYDICNVPLSLLREQLTHLGQEKNVIIYNDIETLITDSKNHFDISLLLFGVLSHVRTEAKRQQLLYYLHLSLKPGGTLILSVPNRKRRFKKLQQQQCNHEITYHRTIDGEHVEFYYYLYNVATIKKTIKQAGLVISNIKAESIFPESWVTRYKLLGWLDYQLCKIIPADWGYGILVSCHKNNEQ